VTSYQRYYITDRRGCPDVLRCIERSAADGVGLIQIREKDLSTRNLLGLTRLALDRVHRTFTRVLVNGRVDVALAAGAHGVHLPANSISPSRIRKIVPAGFTIGVSCHTLDEIRAVREADFVVFGPIFSSPGKQQPVGVGALAEAAAASVVPVFALGGIDESNAEQCLRAGAAGIAGIRMFQRNAG
jgi:thiamine-phosphate pyrophosphorylase